MLHFDSNIVMVQYHAQYDTFYIPATLPVYDVHILHYSLLHSLVINLLILILNIICVN